MGEVEIVYPPISILAVPAVAWVDVNVAKHNSLALSKAYAGAKAAKRRVPARACGIHTAAYPEFLR